MFCIIIEDSVSQTQWESIVSVSVSQFLFSSVFIYALSCAVLSCLVPSCAVLSIIMKVLFDSWFREPVFWACSREDMMRTRTESESGIMATWAGMFGRMDTFNSLKEDWEQYVQKLQYYFTANRVEETHQKKAILLTVVGLMVFKLLRSLVAPDIVEDKTYDELLTAMRGYCCPKPSEVVQTYKFNTRLC